MNLIKLYIQEEDTGRLDTYLSRELDEVSRTYIQKLINEGLVLVNGKQKKPKYMIKEGDKIQVDMPILKEPEVLPENIPLEIIYEDNDLIIVNKPQGMVVHPAPGNYTGTLVNALLYHVDKLSTINGIMRPGIVHRLDKDTSGLLIVAKNNLSHEILTDSLKKREIRREYISLVHGNIDEEQGFVDKPIGRDQKDRKKMAVTSINSKEAKTYYKVLERFHKYTLIEAKLHTGRTHQIRVHLSYINHPVVGDPVYSNIKDKFNLQGQLLHSIRLGFTHPTMGEYMIFETDMPERFKKIISKLN
ncbi:RluA family pseudouridine synthase [Wansuia hejianensis]|uniref:Pseudouridine synthase n=1 Tax=Wansuia hejianensis TaxID=2763667 RepID=A0A926IMH4_9FIRM|nr:RluA family pseudouridine synthase [Wansuia hejianensis]MBC8590445.1 RluA family pseudouridine synthase [Wansuia hejianensis]